MRCKICNGESEPLGGGKFRCLYCGNTFFASENAAPAAVESKRYDSGADVFENNIGGILEISCEGRRSAWAGSGYLFSKRGYAMTNAHVAADDDGSPCRKIAVRLCGQTISATVVALADDRAGSGSGPDLAILRLASLPFGATALSFEQVENIRNGEEVFVVGNSLGDGTCITSGIVSDKRRRLNGKELLMTDCAINGGNSGGPIFNRKGLVIGTICSSRIHQDGSATEGMNYAVPVDIVKRFIEQASRQLGIAF